MNNETCHRLSSIRSSLVGQLLIDQTFRKSTTDQAVKIKSQSHQFSQHSWHTSCNCANTFLATVKIWASRPRDKSRSTLMFWTWVFSGSITPSNTVESLSPLICLWIDRNFSVLSGLSFNFLSSYSPLLKPCLNLEARKLLWNQLKRTDTSDTQLQNTGQSFPVVSYIC